jgi:hypothetical protein
VKRLIVAIAAGVVSACAAATTSDDALGTGSDQDPVVKLARQTLVTDKETCLLATTQGPRRLVYDDFESTSAGSAPAWPMNSGYDAEFSADWDTLRGRARVGNPTWPGADRNAPPLPVTTGFVKFIDVCPLPGSSLALSAIADTTDANDAITDATMVLYVFDGSSNLISVSASYALRAGNRRLLAVRGVALPLNARRVAVVPMARLGPTELRTVYFDDLAVDVEPSSTVVAEVTDDFSTSENGTYGTNQPAGWGEWGGADFFTYNGAWATVWNGSWGGEPLTVPPFEGGAFKTQALPAGVRAGDQVVARVLSANTFKDTTSYSMYRLTMGARVAESNKLFGTAWSNLEATAVVPAGATSFTQELLVGLGPAETSSLYFDDLSVQFRRPGVLARAAKTYSPGRDYDAVFELGATADAVIPSTLPIDTQTYAGAASPWNLTAGNAGNQSAKVSFRNAAGAVVECTYKSGANQSHPTTAAQLALAASYRFQSCGSGALAGATVEAVQITVHLESGDNTLAATRVAVPLSWSFR